MLYLFAESKTICKWCNEMLVQIVEDDPSKVIIRLCPICDRWPDNFMGMDEQHSFKRQDEEK